MGKGQIAGILQRLGCLLGAVTGASPAVEQLGAAGDLLRPLAVEGGIQVDGAAIQSLLVSF